MTFNDAGLRSVAEVIGRARGSGYQIAPGRILTALHVVLGQDPPEMIPDGAGAEVRLFGDIIEAIPRRELGWNHAANQAALAKRKLPWHQARLAWPRAGTPSRATDIALLEVADPEQIQIVPPDRLRIPSRQREDQCFAGGFPGFRAENRSDSAIWEFYQFKGELNPAPRRSDGARYVDVASLVLPDDVDGWRGMSGAALWLDDEDGVALLGVMHALVGQLELNNQLLYWPLDSVDPRDPDFWQLTGLVPPDSNAGSRVGANTGAKPLVAQLADNFFRFDRANFSDSFREWLCGDPAPMDNETPRFHRQGLPSKPAVILLRGHRLDEPPLCAQRFADILAVEAWPGSAALYQAPLHLDSGPYTLPPRGRLRTLLRQWAQSYSDQRLALDADITAIIRDGLADGCRSRCILVEHSQAEFGEGCRDVIAGALGPLRGWKPDPKAPTTPPVMLLSILTGKDGGPSAAAFRPPKSFEGKAARVDAALAELMASTPEIEWFVEISDLSAELARPHHVSEWLEEIMAIEAAALPAGIGAEIEMRLRPHVEFPIAFARLAVDSVIKERRS